MNRLLILVATALLTAALAGCDSSSGPPPAPGTATATTPEVQAVSRPARIRIPSLQVDANIIDLGLQANGEMQVPPDAKDAGWYTKSPIPGQTGPAVIAAHVNWKGVDGPFAHIDQLKADDQVVIVHDNGAIDTFAVMKVETVPKDDYPADTVYADTPGPELRLITCGGTFDADAHSYTSNVIAFAKLAD